MRSNALIYFALDAMDVYTSIIVRLILIVRAKVGIIQAMYKVQTALDWCAILYIKKVVEWRYIKMIKILYSTCMYMMLCINSTPL